MKSIDCFSKIHNPNMGYHFLRIFLAVMMLMHGVAKLSKGTAGIEGMLANIGLPGFIAYGVFLGELVAPALMLLGLFVVPAAIVMVVNMVFAIGLAHMGQIFTLTNSGGWGIELQAFFLVTAIVVAMQAPKPLSKA